MKVSLIRHFEVIQTTIPNTFITSKQYEYWLKGYDTADIRIKDVVSSECNWDICYSSDLPRAAQTAKAIFNGEIIQTSLLREIPLCPFTRSNIKLPLFAWNIIGRAAWLISHRSQSESKKKTIERVKEIVNIVLVDSSENILIVSHGALLLYLRKELLKKGFRGEWFTKPDNGRIYIFEKEKQ